jgi:Type VI secretion system/phage-baseplate injector OB domain
MTENSLLVLVMDLLRSRFYGKYRGVVTDNADPTSRGRLKVTVKSVCGDDAVWAMPCVPYAGDGVGLMTLPEPDTGVWVEFEGGDPSFPIWTGFFWADGEAPGDGDPAIKIWKTSQSILTLDDDAGTLRAETAGGASVELGSDVTSAAASATHTVGGDGVVSDGGGGKLEVTPSAVSLNSGAMQVVV